jgi:PAS domain S-box-containing protein
MPTTILGFNSADAFAIRPELRRVRNGIRVLYVALLALTLAIAVRTSLSERADRFDDARNNAVSLARALDQHVTGLIDGASQYLIDLRNVVEESGALEGVQPSLLNRILEGQVRAGAIRRAFLVDEHGTRVGPSLAAEDGFNVADRRWFQAHRNDRSRALRISSPVRSVIDGKWVVPLSVRIDKPDGSFGGAAAASLGTDFVIDFYRSLGVHEGGSIAMVRNDGALLMRYPRSDQFVLARIPEANLSKFVGAEGVVDLTSSVDGTERIAAYRRGATHPLLVVVSLSREQVLGAWERDTLQRAAGALLVVLLLTLFTLVLLKQLRRELDVAISLQHFRQAVDNSADFVFWARSDGRLVYTNEAAAKRLGYSPSQIVHVTVPDIAPEYPLAAWEEFWTRLTQAQKLRLETDALPREGPRFPIGIAASYVRIGQEDYAFAIGRDLTEERRIFAEVRALNVNLEQRVRERTEELARTNSELASFSYSVSHDLRAPLRHMLAFLQMLREDAQTSFSPEGLQRLTRIEERTAFMSSLIEGLLKLSQVSQMPLHKAEVDLSRVADDILRELQRAEPQRSVVVAVDGNHRVIGDPALLTALLQNLLGNAWKYTRDAAPARIAFGANVVGGHAVYSVRDNGAGFEPKYAARMFSAFQRFHPATEFEGLGVGLATCKRIVERHGGRIWAESAPGEGASFFFTFQDTDT